MTRRQLLDLGMPSDAIRRRLDSGRLHRLWNGIYAVGRPDLGRLGELMSATLACGPDAQLSHRSGAELWKICRQMTGRSRCRSRAGRSTAAPESGCIEGLTSDEGATSIAFHRPGYVREVLLDTFATPAIA